MVAFTDGEHEHSDGELCPGCQFKKELAEHLEWAAGDSAVSWHEATGEIMYLMCGALTALTALRAGRIDPELHEDDSATMAADAISGLARAIEELRDVLMEDD